MTKNRKTKRAMITRKTATRNTSLVLMVEVLWTILRSTNRWRESNEGEKDFGF